MRSEPPRLKDWSDDERVRQVHDFFSAITPSYDLTNRVISLGMDGYWRKVAVAQLDDARHILDIATGTGDMLHEMLRQKQDRKLVGLDFVRDMVIKADAKLKQPARENIALVHGDALSLPFADVRFDGVTIAFGLRNIPDKSTALSEFLRVLKPAGKLVVLDLSLREANIMGAFNRWYMSRIVPRVGRLLSGSNIAYQYLNDSMDSMNSLATLKQTFVNSGFTDVSVRNLFPGVVFILSAQKTE